MRVSITGWSRRRLAAVGVVVLATAAAAAIRVHRTEAGTFVGPDVVVFNLTDVHSNGPQDGFMGYAVGTRSCNRGDAPLNWCDEGGGCGNGTTSHDHPVIAQNVYRLKDGRFEQIGQSWLKHGFLSTNSTTSSCNGAQGQSCTSPPLGGSQLGVGCTDPYVASLNEARPLGRRSEVDGSTGAYPFPYSSPPGPYTAYDQRAKVAVADVDPTLNPGAVYFAEGHYIAPDDATQGNGLNNASHRQVTISGSPSYVMSLTGTFHEQEPGIYAWKHADADVEQVDVDVPASSPVQRFIAARKVTDLGGGLWHYEYALYNLNSDRSGRSLTVTFSGATDITNVGFHDVDSHSGEPYSTTDWTETIGSDSVSWSTDDFATDANANALRWATLYSFWFDADRAPGQIQQHTLELFKPGSPTTVDFWGVGSEIFTDGFESGDTSAWSATVP